MHKKIFKVFESLFNVQDGIRVDIIMSKYGDSTYEKLRKYFMPDYLILNQVGILKLTKRGAEYYLSLKKQYDDRMVSVLYLQSSITIAIFTLAGIWFNSFYSAISKITLANCSLWIIKQEACMNITHGAFWGVLIILIIFGLFMLDSVIKRFFRFRGKK